MSILYEKFKKYQVPASSVEDFRRRYTKPDRFAQRGPEYQAAVLQAARDDLAQFGYTIISRHDSLTAPASASAAGWNRPFPSIYLNLNRPIHCFVL